MNYENLFKSFEHKNILIIGDVMLDSYVLGKVERISPEAPVPIVNVESRDNRLGGAANVALNISTMGARPILCSLIGNDNVSNLFLRLLRDNTISDRFIYKSNFRCTTTKMRIIGGNSQLLRIDEEFTENLNEIEEKDFLDICLSVFESEKIDAIIFEDYDKGLLNENIITKVVGKANELGIPIVVDPKKRNFMYYKGVSLFKPNLKEIKEGLNLDSLLLVKDIERAADDLRERLSCKCVMVTLSERGVLINTDRKTAHIPAHLRKISDVSGAGDTVISLAALCLSEGLDIEEIAKIANMAGGLVCEQVGVVSVNKEELLKELKKED